MSQEICKHCADLAQIVPGLADCCTSCHEDGDDEMPVRYRGEKYLTCCAVSEFMKQLDEEPDKPVGD